MLREISDLAFHDLEISSTASSTISQDLVVDNNLTINSGGTLSLSTMGLTVEGMLANNGTLIQTKDVPAGSMTEFLRIKDAAGTTDKYFGIEVTPGSGSMASTTVAISGNQQCPGWTGGVQRCYEITPATSQTAVTRFYYRLFEANGQSNPLVFHWNGTAWDELTTSAVGGSGEGLYAEATTTSYSPFALGDTTPTHATIGRVALKYLSIDEPLEALAGGKQGLRVLLALLAAWDPDLAASLADADIEQVLEALRGELDPDGDGSVAVLEWETLEQRGTIGFYAERQTNNGAWERINERILPAVIDGPLGAEYWLFDRNASDSTEYRYRLIEQEAWGTTLLHGPWLLQLGH